MTNINNRPLLKNHLGYDFRFDYELVDNTDIDYVLNHVNNNNNNNNSNNNNNNFDYENLKRSRKRELIYNWAPSDSIITRLLLLIKFIKVKKVRSKGKLKSDKLLISSSKSNNKKLKKKLKSRFKGNSKIRLKSKTSGQLNLKILKEQQYIDRLDPNSVEFKILKKTDKSKLRHISRDELSKHIIPSSSHVNKFKLEKNSDGIWMLIHGFVFDISNILESHPGGVECLLDCVGVDATRVFDDVGHSDIAWKMLENCCVGVIDDLCINTSYEQENETNNDNNNNNNDTNDNDNDNNDNNRDISDEIQLNDDFLDFETDYDDNEINKEKLVWNNKLLESLIFIIISMFSLICFIFLQIKKLDEWGNWTG
jgi:hypothetical protein